MSVVVVPSEALRDFLKSLGAIDAITDDRFNDIVKVSFSKPDKDKKIPQQGGFLINVGKTSVQVKVNSTTGVRKTLKPGDALRTPYKIFFVTHPKVAGEPDEDGEVQSFSSSDYIHAMTRICWDECMSQDCIVSRDITVVAAGTAIQGEDIAVPSGFSVILLADPDNTGKIFIGGSKNNAENPLGSFPMEPGRANRYFIRNFKNIWADAAVSGEKLFMSVESPTCDDVS